MSTINVGYIEGPSTASNKIYIKSGSVLDITNSPDGAASIDLAVDAGDITGGTLTAARLPVGTIINSEMFTNSTYAALPSTSSYSYWSVNYTKKLTDSILVVTAFSSFSHDAGGVSGIFVEIDGTKYYTSSYTYTAHGYPFVGYGLAQKQVSTSGTKTISLGWLTANGSASQPAVHLNYNSTQDARSPQHGSSIHIMEVTV